MALDKDSLQEFLTDDYFIEWVLNPTPENTSFWTSWFKQNPASAKELLEARNLILLVKLQPSRAVGHEAAAVWDRVEAAILEAEAQQTADRHTFIPKTGATGFAWFSRSRALAASLVFGVLLAGLGYLFSPYLSAHSSHLTLEKRLNPYGQRSALMLPDGSRVFLNAGSTLAYAPDFDEQPQRLVHLQGEAFFEVVKNKQRPFIVKTDGLAIKVLGTRFNVKAYADEEAVETTLVSGQVQLNREEKPAGVPEARQAMILLPNQQAHFTRGNGKIRLAAVDPQVYAAWVEGKLLFQDMPLKNVVKVLSRAYNVRIQIENPDLEHCTLTADLSNLPLTQTLEIMCRLVEARFSKSGKGILIKGNGCRKNR